MSTETNRVMLRLVAQGEACESRYHPEALKGMRENVWGEHSYWTRDEWKQDVVSDGTNQGYWEWLSDRLNADDEEGGSA